MAKLVHAWIGVYVSLVMLFGVQMGVEGYRVDNPRKAKVINVQFDIKCCDNDLPATDPVDHELDPKIRFQPDKILPKTKVDLFTINSLNSCVSSAIKK